MPVNISNQELDIFNKNGFSDADVKATVDNYRSQGLSDTQIRAKIDSRLKQWNQPATPVNSPMGQLKASAAEFGKAVAATPVTLAEMSNNIAKLAVDTQKYNPLANVLDVTVPGYKEARQKGLHNISEGINNTATQLSDFKSGKADNAYSKFIAPNEELMAESFSDLVKNPYKILPTAARVTGEQLPLIAGGIVGKGAGMAAGAKLGNVAAGMGNGLGKTVVTKAAQVAPTVGTNAGAFASSYLTQNIYNEQRRALEEQLGRPLTPEEDEKVKQIATQTQTLSAAFDALPVGRVFERAGKVAKPTTILGKVKNVAGDVIGQGAEEGATEFIQSLIEDTGSNKIGTTDYNLQEKLNRAAGQGAIALLTGGVMGGGANAISQFNGTNSTPEINGIYNEIKTKLEQAGIDTQTVEAQAEIGRQVENVLVDKYGQDAVNLLKERDLQLNVNDNANFEKRVSGEIIGQNTGKIIDEGSTPVEEQQNKGNFFSNVIQSFNDFINQPTAFDKLREIRNVTPEMLQQNNPVDEINNDLNNYMNLLSIQDSKSFHGVKLDNSQLKAVKRKIHDYENSFESQREFINQNLDNLNVEALRTVKSNIEGNYKNKTGEVQNGYNAYGIPVTPEAIRNEKLLEQQKQAAEQARIKEAEEFNKRNLNVFKRKVDKKNLEKLSDELLLDKTDDLNIIEPQYNNEKRKIATEIVSNATGKGYDYVQMVAKSGSQKFAKRRENLYDNLQDTEDRLNGADVVTGTNIGKYYNTNGLTYNNDEAGAGYDLAYQAWDDLASDNFYDNLSRDDVINNALVNVDKEMRTGLKDILNHPNSYKEGKRVAKFAERMSELIEELPKEVQGDYYNQLYDSLEKVQNYMDNKKTYNQKSPFRLKGEIKYNQAANNQNGNSNYDEIQSKFEQEYIDREQIAEDEARLSSDIDKHLKKQLGRNKIYFGKAPAILQNFGVPNLAMYMPQNKYDSSTGRLKVDGNIHNISDNVMKKIPTLLSDPIMIAYPTDESNYKGNSRLVASLNEVDNDGKPINVIIDYDWTGNRVNIIPTVYGREEFENYVNKCFKENKIVYTDEKNLLSHISKVQFPRGNSKGYNTIITDKGDLFKSSKKYSQEKTKKPSPFVRKDEPIVRGSLTIDSKTGKAIIDVLKSGDESTIPHELAHFYMNAVETLAQKDNTRAQKELEEINNWLGKQADTEYSQDELIEFDEKFARGFEAYLREGIAPTDNLGRVFIKFRNWLRDIYKSAEDLDVPMNEDTKKFFDRIFTTDKEFNELYKKNSKLQAKIEKFEKSPFVRKTKVQEFIHEGKKSWDKLIVPMDTILERIDPKLKTKLRKHTAETNIKIQENIERIKPFLDKMKNLDKEIQSALDLALKNNKRITIDDILNKNGMAEDFAEVRHLLDDIYSDAVAAGIDVNYLSEYFPRTPKKGYENKYLQFIEDKFNGLKPDVFESLFGISKEEYSKTLRMLRDKDPHNVWTTEDKAKFINNAIKGYNDRNILKLHTPGNLKFERKIGQLDEELNAFYEDSMTALMGYVTGVQELIATKEFFGGENSEIAKIRTKMKNKNKMIQEVRKRPVSQAKAKEIARLQYEMAPLQAKLEIIKDSGSKEEKEALKKKINRLQEQIDYFEKANPFMVKNIVIKRLKGDLENFKKEIQSIRGVEEDTDYTSFINNSIGNLVLEMEQKGEITKEEEDILKEVLKARFNPTNMHVMAKTIRDLTYGFTMNDIQNAVTQVGDLSFTMYKYGAKNTVKGIMDRYDISKDDIGLSEIAYEFSDPSFLQKYVKELFKRIGLSPMDGFGKNTSINASLHDAKERIQKNDKEINERLSGLFGNEAEQVKQDILDGKITTNVKIFAFDKLADLQPISPDQQTILQANGGSRTKLMYTLKSYGLKAIDIARKDITDNIIQGIKTKDKGLIIKGLKNAVRLQAFLWLMGIPKDVIKDLLSNREINVLDSLLDNLIPAQIVSRFLASKVFSTIAEWLNPKTRYKAKPIYLPILEFLYPLFSIIDSFNEPYGLITRVPFGRNVYNWWLKKDDKKLINPLPSPFKTKKKKKAS